MGGRDRDIYERTLRAVAEQARKTNAIVNETHSAGLDGSHPVAPRMAVGFIVVSAGPRVP